MKKLFLLLLLTLYYQPSVGLSVIDFSELESAVIERSLDVVEGSVVSASGRSKPESKDCFSYIYKLKVTNSLKRKFSKDDEITIGLNHESIVIFPGQKQLVVLQDTPEDFFDYCSVDLKRYKAPDIKILFSHSIGLFEISDENVNHKGCFRALRCDRGIRFMYQDSLEVKFKEETINGMSCESMVGEYKSLKELFLRDL